MTERRERYGIRRVPSNPENHTTARICMAAVVFLGVIGAIEAQGRARAAERLHSRART
jgi:hypothetical protein